MIGNDIVDLALSRIESNWQRAGIQNKLFTIKEQQFIENSDNAELLFWTFWSRKEAVYKIIARDQNLRKFIPLQLECSSIAALSTVSYLSEIYHVKTSFHDELIHSVAVYKVSDLELVSEVDKRVDIFKEGVLPFLYEDGFLQPVSISHHGRFHKVVKLEVT